MNKSFNHPHSQQPHSHDGDDKPGRNTLTIPTNLIRNHRDSPLTIGVYCLIARLYTIYKKALPISDVDFALYDPTLTPGRITRAMRRLVKDGLVVKVRVGCKNTYRPGWGHVLGTPRLWDFNKPILDRPRRLVITPFDKRMFDLYFGRIQLHERLPARVERYSSAPILSLQDVGAYLLVKTGEGQATDALHKCGLVREGRAMPLPDEPEILAWISQQTITNKSAPMLTDQGFRRLGFKVLPPKEPAKSGGKLLVYIPPENGGLITSFFHSFVGLEGQKTGSKTAVLPALEADNPLSNFEAEKITWTPMELNQNPTPTTQVVVGRPKFFSKKDRPLPEGIPNTLTAQALQEIGVRPKIVRELCNEPHDYVKEIIIQGRLRTDVRSLAAWTVSALRDTRDHGWRPTANTPKNGDLDLEKYTTGEYAQSFGLKEDSVVDEETTLLKDQAEPDAVMRWIQATLCHKFSRVNSLIVLAMRLLDAGEVPVIGCASEDDLAAVADNLDYHIIKVFQEFGWRQPPRFVLTADWLSSSDQPKIIS